MYTRVVKTVKAVVTLKSTRLVSSARNSGVIVADMVE